MPVNKRKQLELAERRREVLRLFRMGLKQHQIAERLGLHGANGQVLVSRDLDAVRKQWKAGADRDLSIETGRILNEYEAVRTAAWAAWERSKEGRTTAKDKKLFARRAALRRRRGGEDDGHEGNGDGRADGMELSRVERERATEERDGDPRFLALIVSCLSDEADLQGLKKTAGEPVCVGVIAFDIGDTRGGGPAGEVIDADELPPGLPAPPLLPPQPPPSVGPDEELVWVDDGEGGDDDEEGDGNGLANPQEEGPGPG